MSKPSERSTSEIVVQLITPGVPVRDFHLSEGATLADLLRSSGVSTTDQKIFVGGIPIEEALTLSDGAVVTIVPQNKNGVGNEPWRGVISAFQDDALFEEYMAIIKAQRLEDYPDEEPGA